MTVPPESSRPSEWSERSWWLGEAMVGEAMVGEVDTPPLESDLDVDVCIIGGGFTGLWTALRLKQLDPQINVALVEAEVCGAGASGRNGGMALTLWHHFIGLQRICDNTEAVRLARASADAVAEIGRFCAEHGIDAQYRPDGWLWTATNAAQGPAWNASVDAIARCGEQPFRKLQQDEVELRGASRSHIGGVFEATAATVQPALLARGLRRVALEQGVRIFEHSPMIELERSSTLRVRTPRGSVRAQRVVVAMNAWSSRLRELRGAFVTVSSDIVITEPVPDVLQNVGWLDGIGISDSRLMVHYYRTTPEGRVAFGKGTGAVAYGSRITGTFDGPSSRAPIVGAALRATYPQLADVPLASTWSGPIDRAVDGLPFFTTLGRPDLICGAGFSGNGVGPTVLGGRILASLVLERTDEWSSCGLVRPSPGGLPPEPLRSLGGRVVRGAVTRKERAEDAGHAPRWIDRRLAGLAPAGLVPTD